MDFLKKLFSSANFWTGLIAVAGAIASAYGLSAGSVQQITAIISAASVLLASIFGYNIQAAAQIKADASVKSAQLQLDADKARKGE